MDRISWFTYEQCFWRANTQALIRFVVCSYGLHSHQIVHTLEEAYRSNHQRHTPDIYTVCHLPVRGQENKSSVVQLKQCVTNIREQK